MAVQIPPWLNIDPIEPARIQAATNQRRAANAAAERRAALEEQRLFAQQQMLYARLAAQERADARRQEVFRQTKDAQLAQQAAAMEMRRQMAQRQADQQMRAMKLRESQVESKAMSAARQMQGMRQLQEDMKSMPPDQALQKNAELLFADRPERFASSMRALRPPAGATPLSPDALVRRPIVDASGRPTGHYAIPGARGTPRLLPGQEKLSPEGHARVLSSQLNSITSRLRHELLDEKEEAKLKTRRDDIMSQLDKLTGGTSGASEAPTMERLPGKEDEREEDFILPPTEMPEAGEDEAEAEAALPAQQEVEEEDFFEEEI
jgi:multidrug efflux pump subunit AcrA (membrane-fusion protein)